MNNKQVNIKLKKLFKDKEITRCENCNSDYFLTFAHRKKRRHYLEQPELLTDFNQVLLLCINCHQEIEYDREKTAEMFNRLRL